MKKKIIAATILAVALPLGMKAQDNVETTISADMVSQYIWRGQELGKASLQPTLGVSYKGISLSAWGSVGLSEPSDSRELDLTLGYEYEGLSLGITDYWFDDDRYFLYKADTTPHVFEAYAGYDFGFASLAWYTNIGGADGVNLKEKTAYSSYFELGVPFQLGGVDFTASLGAVPYATDFYSGSEEGFALVNASLMAGKEISVSDSFSIPVFAGICTNPAIGTAHLVFGLTISAF